MPLEHLLYRSNFYFVVGGAEIYTAMLPYARIVEETIIQAACDGDAFFPELGSDWDCLSRSDWFPADAKNQYPYQFVRWERG